MNYNKEKFMKYLDDSFGEGNYKFKETDMGVVAGVVSGENSLTVRLDKDYDDKINVPLIYLNGEEVGGETTGSTLGKVYKHIEGKDYIDVSSPELVDKFSCQIYNLVAPNLMQEYGLLSDTPTEGVDFTTDSSSFCIASKGMVKVEFDSSYNSILVSDSRNDIDLEVDNMPEAMNAVVRYMAEHDASELNDAEIIADVASDADIAKLVESATDLDLDRVVEDSDEIDKAEYEMELD